ncbi:MAG: hypothetical protein RSD95_12675, partial [Clostridia bacterium]
HIVNFIIIPHFCHNCKRRFRKLPRPQIARLIAQGLSVMLKPGTSAIVAVVVLGVVASWLPQPTWSQSSWLCNMEIQKTAMITSPFSVKASFSSCPRSS